MLNGSVAILAALRPFPADKHIGSPRIRSYGTLVVFMVSSHEMKSRQDACAPLNKKRAALARDPFCKS